MLKLDEFKLLVKFLRKNGYTIKVSHKKEKSLSLNLVVEYKIAELKDKKIRLAFATVNPMTYSYLSGKVCIENDKCFDKWSKCPVNLPLPKTEMELEYILYLMRVLSTNEGAELSNHFDMWVKSYPKYSEN